MAEVGVGKSCTEMKNLTATIKCESLSIFTVQHSNSMFMLECRKSIYIKNTLPPNHHHGHAHWMKQHQFQSAKLECLH